MSRLTDLSLANRSLAALATIVIAIAGVISALTLKQELLPAVQSSVLTATTAVPGADAAVVDAQVTRSIERAAQGLAGVEQVQSTSSAGQSTVTVTLESGADLQNVRGELQSAIAGLTSLPAGVTPRVVAETADNLPILQLSAVPPGGATAETGAGAGETPTPVPSDPLALPNDPSADPNAVDPNAANPGADPNAADPNAPADATGVEPAFVQALNDSVIPKLSKIDGVRDVQLGGVADQKVTITLDPARAAAAGVSLETVSAALAANGIAVPAGSITEGAGVLNVQVGAPFATVQEVGSIPLLGAVPPDPAAAAAAAAAPTPAAPAVPGVTPSANNAPVRQAQVRQQNQAPANGVCVTTAGQTCTATADPQPPGTATTGTGTPGTNTQTCRVVLPDLTCSVLYTVPTPSVAASTAVRSTTVTAPAQTVTQRVTVNVPSYVTVQAPAPTTPKVPPPTLDSVAQVSFGSGTVSSYTRTNGKPSLTLSVRRAADGNTVAISDAVRAQLTDLKKTTGGNFEVIYDQAPYIERSIRGLTTEGLLGLGFAILVVLAFLRSLRMTVVTAVSIPMSLLIALIGLRAGHYSLNLLTLAGLTIAVGRVVDDSIVVVENVTRHLDAGQDKLVAIPAAVREVAGAITASTVATAAVFAPIAVITGPVGDLFRPFALTVVVALLGSLLVALTIVPVLAYWLVTKQAARTGARPGQPARPSRRGLFGRTGTAARPGAPAGRHQTGAPPDVTPAGGPAATAVMPSVGAEPRPAAGAPTGPSTGSQAASDGTPATSVSGPPAGAAATSGSTTGQVPVVTAAATATPATAGPPPSRLRSRYLSLLGGALRRPVATLAVAALILVLTAVGATQLKTDFLGESGQDTLFITQELPAGTSLAATDTAAQKVEQVLADRRDLASYQVNVGTAGASPVTLTPTAGENQAHYLLSLKDGVDSQAVATALRANFASRPELGTFTVGTGDRAQPNTVDVQVSASDLAKLTLASTRVFDQVKRVQGVSGVTNNHSGQLPSIRVSVNRQAAANAGLTEAGVGEVVQAALRGASVGHVSVGNDPYGAVVVAPAVPVTVDELRNVAVAGTTLGALASIDEVTTQASIDRLDGELTASITAVPGDDLGQVTDDVTRAVERANLPAGTSATIGGVSADQREAFGQLGLALLAAIVLVYLVMVATFRSLLQPLLLLASVPFAATGAVAALLVTRTPLGVAAIVGLLMLVGIVVTNAIVLLDLVNRYRRAGGSVHQGLLDGAGNRLRPILMTALATIFALVPLAVALTGGGAFISQPLALVVIGGLLTSTVLTLFIVPVLYWLVEGRAERRTMPRTNKPTKAAKPAKPARAAKPPKPARPPKPPREPKPPKEPRQPKPRRGPDGQPLPPAGPIV